ncbi:MULTISPECIES: NAD(P)-dependent oxidoreductase [unclassified Bradyrhizobium]|uniref:NAD(P)-dependent oxidoreductase n=1 Tax=unclassified Bradyrhizobium TaxID=2631580 RepID=UPI002478438F|nr:MULTISPECIES: NAD(P)-dependent oxidoreductase [unclassified Bradyrhizobium]WGR68330.1 NAD(P)-dependent oxidoreductase [Bradyrhizobium sp. ISRA426]WGR80385.1 NAD(P)-dependent oxidoreductase [Bradyrhizobium sp. ISRA430]WGR83570.1 NAD(P)-dependent oxidoreductase [Bradyrhizobium sp. ISRA432]
MGRDDKGSVGFIGIGTMGREMVRNLLKAGHAVRAFDLNGAPVADVVKEGAARAQNPADAARGADVVVTMLPDTPHVEATIYGEDGLLKSPPPGKLIVDMSTISPVAVRRIHADLKQTGVSFIDAPVSGGPLGAKNAALSIMAGGDTDAFAQAEPFFRAMGTTITHVGASGAGQTVKLCNQLICGINIQAICEALALGRASGVDLNLLRRVLLGGSAASWMLDKLGPAMIEGDVGAGFRIDLMLKDLRLVQEHAQALNVPLPGTALVTSQYVDARAHGEGTNGNQALFRVYDRMTNQVTG